MPARSHTKQWMERKLWQLNSPLPGFMDTGVVLFPTAFQEVVLGQHALALVVNCLQYDFIGTNPDDSAEDVGTIQVPSTWRMVVQDPGTMDLLFSFYRSTTPPRSSSALQVKPSISGLKCSRVGKRVGVVDVGRGSDRMPCCEDPAAKSGKKTNEVSTTL